MYFQLFVKPKRRITFSEEEVSKATKLINFLNGKKDLYRSVYNYISEPAGRNAFVDKIFFDFDPDGKNDPLGDLNALAEYCIKKNISFTPFFSGRGYHFYIHTHKLFAYELNSPSLAIREFVLDIINKLGIVPDMQVVGDLMRVSRIPNTLNKKTGLFCIPLSKKEALIDDPDYFKKEGSKQRTQQDAYGEQLIDLRKYDGKSRHKMTVPPISNDVNCTQIADNIPMCVKNALHNRDPGYQERFLIITCLRDLAYTLPEVEKILEEYLSQEKFEHCVFEEEQLDYLFKRQELLFPSCDTIKMQGYCVEGCKGQEIYI